MFGMRNIDGNFARPAPPERLDGIEHCMRIAEAAKQMSSTKRSAGRREDW